MKTKPTSTLFAALWLALAFALVPVLRAQEKPPAPAAPAATEEKAAPAPATEQPTVAADEKPVAPEAPAAPAAIAATPAEEKKTDAPLRELGADDKAPKTGEKSRNSRHSHIQFGSRHSDNARVSFFQDSTLAAGEQADAVVSIGGSSTSAGEVNDAVVSVLGSSTSSGEVGNAVVSVIGDTRVTGGTVGDAAVAVLGTTHVNGHVKGQVVAVLGNIELGPEAVVDGEMVCIGGEVIRDAKAVVHGNVQHIAIGGHHFNFVGLRAWIEHCFLYARPLAFGEHLLWAWCIALAFLALYTFVALVAPGGVTKCAQTLEERPGYSILSAVLTMLLTPVAYLLLVLTLAIGIGFALIPLFSLGLFFAAIFGKVVMLAWLGRRITKFMGDGPLAHPVFAVLIGGAIVLGLYTVPVVGFIVYKLMGVLGLGVVVYTLLLLLKSNRAAAAAAKSAATAVAAASAAAAAAAVPPVLGEPTGAVPMPPQLPAVISAATLPRAGFWLRFLASLLDAVMVGIAFGMLHRIWGGFGGIFPFWYAVYCVVMWATKGTTIGGIICGLKLVRLDDRPVDWSVAAVRALSAFLSLAVAGLGFIWVAFDDDKQSWHDKIAGTTIVKVPKGTPLL
jgi:uncharacterized RDD family membrane protein YckC